MSKPNICVLDTAEAIADAVAQHVARTLVAKPQATLGLATGKTFISIYASLVRHYRQEGFSFAEAASFNLDEYVGLPDGHPASFRSYMNENLFRHVDLPSEQAQLPGVEGDLDLACAAYEEAIKARGGIDLQLLGIGQNGHIGFNEPGSAFDSRTRMVELTASTIVANTSDFPPGETPPGNAVTMGIGTILEAREIVLVALGAKKAEVLLSAFEKPASRDCPASALLGHPNVTVYCDAAASALLSGRR